MASVCLEGVSKVYPGGVTAVRRLELEIADRELLVLLGPSGCGKTTALRLIAGLEKPDSGVIRIGDCVVNRVAARDRNVAMVFQHSALYPHWRVYKNLAFGLELRYGGGWLSRAWGRLARPTMAAALAARRRGIRQQVRQTAQILGIEHLLDRLPHQLSGGERQCVALGRAMVRQPAVFLLDEPLSNLDARLRWEMRRELHQLHQRLQATMVYVTHDQTEAMTLGERIAVMDRGELQQVGRPQAIYDRPRNQFVAGFVGSPPMNLVPGRLRLADGLPQFCGEGLAVELPFVPRRTRGTDDVNLGIRPEHVQVVVGNSAAGPAVSACGRVALVESLGDRSLVYVETAGGNERAAEPGRPVVSVTEAGVRLAPGDIVGLSFDARGIHLFDGRSGENLTAEQY